MKDSIKKMIPESLKRMIRRFLNSTKTRDNVDERYSDQDLGTIFSGIYKDNEWAKGAEKKYKKEDASFYSGSGSYNEAAEKYINFMVGYIREHNIRSMTDVGCGDFNIGKQLCEQIPGLIYNGVDIVPDLIEHNRKVYGTENIRFFVVNTLENKVPAADILVIRQVLQHLSNNDIQRVITNCFDGFPHILITEHQVKKPFLAKPNIDKASGPNTRLGFGSGVYLNKPPFNLQWTMVFSADDNDNDRCEINTYKIV